MFLVVFGSVTVLIGSVSETVSMFLSNVVMEATAAIFQVA